MKTAQLAPREAPASPERKESTSRSAVTRNACRLCAPLGAALAYKGVQGCMPVFHGGQGCSTYVRRYLIGHFREPVDIGSTNFTEATTVHGGSNQLGRALDNICSQYAPACIGLASTCLSETIGEDIEGAVRAWRARNSDTVGAPEVVTASTPSYRGSHAMGYRRTVAAITAYFAGQGARTAKPYDGMGAPLVGVFPGMVSPADLRLLKSMMQGLGIEPVLVPDYSDTLDGSLWEHFQPMPEGGTSPEALRRLDQARMSLQLGGIPGAREDECGPLWLQKHCGVPRLELPLPIGIKGTDRMVAGICDALDLELPEAWQQARGRVLDAYSDGHKYVHGKRALVYGDAEFAAALCGFLQEIGMEVAMVATGEEKGTLTRCLEAQELEKKPLLVLEDTDFETIKERAGHVSLDLMIGSSKGYRLSRDLSLPLLRLGFPIHDRLGGARLLHLGYQGAGALFDTLVNLLLARRQEMDPVGYPTL